MFERFVARQPIFDRRLNVFGYELLFRNGAENHFSPAEHAAANVIVDSTMLLSLDALTGRNKTFLNLSHDELRSGAALLLPRASTIIEITQQFEVNVETILACQDLKAAGYQLALDGFQEEPRWEPLLPFASFLKVDFRATSARQQRSITQQFSGTELRIILKKIESREEYSQAYDSGCSFFQGFFFLRPEILTARDLPANKLNCIRLLGEASASELQYGIIEQILKQEPALLYKLLRYLNSPALALRREVRSIPQAISLLGEKEFRRWVSVVAIVAASMNEPAEVLRSVLTRAYFCEGLSQILGLAQNTTEFFFMGLLSVMDVLFARPLPDILSELPVSKEVSAALLGGNNIFREVYEAAVAYENADWENFQAIASRAKLDQSFIAQKYELAVRQASSLLGNEG